MNVSDAIKDSLNENVVLLVSEPNKYKHSVEEIIINLVKKKLCIVSLNKGYDILAREMKKKNIDITKSFFVDGSPNRGEIKKNKEKISFVSSPEAYTEINVEIKRALQNGAECVVFDSISHSLIYGRHNVLLRYIHDLMSFVRDKDKKIFFIILESDYNQKITKKIEMLVDKVIILGGEVKAAKADASRLIEELFGPQASKIAEKYSGIKNTKNLLDELKTVLSKLVGPENAQAQMDELYKKYNLAEQ